MTHLPTWGLAAWICAGAIVIAADQKPAEPPRATPASAAVSARTPPPDYVIGPGDVLEVLFWHDKDLSADVIVRPDGKITVPLLNEIDAAGMTPDDLRIKLTEQAKRFVE